MPSKPQAKPLPWHKMADEFDEFTFGVVMVKSIIYYSFVG